MTTIEHTESRPIGYWLRATDRMLAAEFATIFENEGITRRDWRLLNAIDGTIPSERPVRGVKLARLAGLGWVTQANGSWLLTDEGRAARERLSVLVEEVRQKVVTAVGEEELAATLASLEKISRAFGWDENTPLPRGERRRGHRRGGHRGHGHARRNAFAHHDDVAPHHCDGNRGHRREHMRDHSVSRDGFWHGDARDFRSMGTEGHPHPRHERGRHMAQAAFERGFVQGFRERHEA